MPPAADVPNVLTPEQGHEAIYRFVAQYYKRERIVPLMLMLTSMRPTRDEYRTNDPAAWSGSDACRGRSLGLRFPRYLHLMGREMLLNAGLVRSHRTPRSAISESRVWRSTKTALSRSRFLKGQC